MADDYTVARQRDFRRQVFGLFIPVLSYLIAMIITVGVLLVEHWRYMACIEAGKHVIGEICVEKEKTDG